MSAGIYRIALADGRCYVGQSSNVQKRFNLHRQQLRKGTHHSRYLQRAWNKHGADAFAFEVLEECDLGVLTEREQWWMDHLRAEFNSAPAAGSNLGIKLTFTAEHRASLSAALRGHPVSEATRAAVAAANRSRVITDEARAKLRAASHKERPWLRGRKHTDEHKAKISAAGIGRNPSAETRAKISAANRGKPKTVEHRAKLRAANIGKRHSADAIAKIRAAQTGRRHSPETLAKMRAAQRKRRAEERVANAGGSRACESPAGGGPFPQLALFG